MFEYVWCLPDLLWSTIYFRLRRHRAVQIVQKHHCACDPKCAPRKVVGVKMKIGSLSNGFQAMRSKWWSRMRCGSSTYKVAQLLLVATRGELQLAPFGKWEKSTSKSWDSSALNAMNVPERRHALVEHAQNHLRTCGFCCSERWKCNLRGCLLDLSKISPSAAKDPTLGSQVSSKSGLLACRRSEAWEALRASFPLPGKNK